MVYGNLELNDGDGRTYLSMCDVLKNINRKNLNEWEKNGCEKSFGGYEKSG